jgi:hypothetical protein
MFRFTIRDMLWLTWVAAVAIGWRLEHRRIGQQNESLLLENVAKTQQLEEQSQKLVAAAKKEKNLQVSVDMLRRLAEAQRTKLKKAEDEFRDSLERREDVLSALRILKETPPPANQETATAPPSVP